MDLHRSTRITVLVLVALFPRFALAGVLTPVNLQCEYRTNPCGLDTIQPRLTWQLQSAERGQVQSAYQIQVATTADLLQSDHPDLWDSGKVASDESVNITYGGQPLTSGTPCFWKVKTWDKSGVPSPWSPPAVWTMGLLHPSDWTGKWIGLDQGEQSCDFAGAKWIWFAEGNPAAVAGLNTRYFRRTFELPPNQPVKSATITLSADDQFHLFVNGKDAAQGTGWSTPATIDLRPFLKPGANTLAIEARNVGEVPNPAGLLAKLNVDFTTGPALTLTTDERWKSAADPSPGWAAPEFNDTTWPPVRTVADYGQQPWGIIANTDRRLLARYLRKDFALTKPIRRATVYFCGQGLSELQINGQKISTDVLSPALSQYDKRSFYVTYDATSAITPGDNALGVVLGNGRYFAPSTHSGMRSFGYPKLILQLNIEHTDGTTTQVVSDQSWKLTTNGPIRTNNEYDGEAHDARLELPDWSKPRFNDSTWLPVQLVEPASPNLSAQIGEPIRVTGTIQPKTLTNPKPGVYVFDLGQNIAGRCRLNVTGSAGTVVKLRHAETLKPDGTIYTANLRTAKAEDTYTLKGGEPETYEPTFTYHGFRYVELTGFPGTPDLSTLQAHIVHDALAEAGEFSTSNPLLNQIHQNIYWTTRDNYRSIPTDLPRDEREGWLGDRQEVAKGESYLFNIAPVYAQWLAAMQDAQREDGSISDVCPAYWPFYQDGTVWPSSYIILPHMLYEQYADLGILRKHYDSMKKWTDHMATFIQDGILPRNTYGDWCVPPRSLTEIHSSDPNADTAGPLLSTALFYHDLRLMEKSARLLGKPQHAERFSALADQLKSSFHRRFFNPKLGYYDNGTQTSCVLPLAFAMVPDDAKTSVFNHLVHKITVESNNHLATGLVGGHYLLRVLADNGRPDLAYTLATQTTYPSWGYMISKGATTMWELWNGDTASPEMNSNNIVMLIGDLNIFLHEHLAGIRPDPTAPGFKKIIINPTPLPGLDWVKATYNSIHGPIQSEWHQSPTQFDLHVSIPPNTTATVYLPAKDLQSITESAHPLAGTQGIRASTMQNTRAVIELGSGEYHFVSTP